MIPLHLCNGQGIVRTCIIVEHVEIQFLHVRCGRYQMQKRVTGYCSSALLEAETHTEVPAWLENTLN